MSPVSARKQRSQDAPPAVRGAVAIVLAVMVIGFILDFFLLPFLGSQQMRTTQMRLTIRHAQTMWERDACINNAARMLGQPTAKIEEVLFAYIGTPPNRQRVTPNEVVIQLRTATGGNIDEKLINSTLWVILDCRNKFAELVTSTNKLVDKIQHRGWLFNRYGGNTDQKLRIIPPEGRPITGSAALHYLGRSDWMLRRTSERDLKTS